METRNSKGKNHAGEQVWRFGSEEGSLYKRLICAKYGMRVSSLLWGWSVVPAASSFVRVVGSLFVDGTTTMRIIGEGFKVAVVNGSRAQFWNDRWTGEMPLKRVFPRIFALTSKKEGI
ncbi:hypothetical protein Ddye_002152 [Dipteronia dyeriana]|uniref:Uncharacterized protein n=1 Tax=Dipteronia dyeriana TaxID=168575 RepID=A0AAD9XR82_9ROSI|nr:hypothetical protein Ddye_002152 [Dipteronia dyeriana]